MRPIVSKYPNPNKISKTKSAPSQTSQTKSLIESNSSFFNTLVELIPPRFYLPGPDDDEKPWFQGLNKHAKAEFKKQSRENLKRSRRQKFNPQNTSSTLQLLQKEITKSKNIGESAVASTDSHALTYEELRQRLHKRIKELKGNRNAKVESEEGPRNYLKKRHKELEEKEQEEEKKNELKRKATDDLAFVKVKSGDEERKRKKKKLSKYQELERAKKLDELKKDPEKGKNVLWKTAESRAMGEKVHDNPKLLKESIKKEKRRQKKSAEKWKDREETQEGLRKEKQQKRSDNIKERVQQKKMRKIEKREKKLMRPGFEGRKEGYINE